MRTGNAGGDTTYSPDDGDQLGFVALLVAWVEAERWAINRRDIEDFAGTYSYTNRKSIIRLRKRGEWLSMLRAYIAKSKDT